MLDNSIRYILGQNTSYILGNVMAFLSGLLFTANNFIIKAMKLSFGEILAVRSIIQVLLMFGILKGAGISIRL